MQPCVIVDIKEIEISPGIVRPRAYCLMSTDVTKPTDQTPKPRMLKWLDVLLPLGFDWTKFTVEFRNSREQIPGATAPLGLDEDARQATRDLLDQLDQELKEGTINPARYDMLVDTIKNPSAIGLVVNQTVIGIWQTGIFSSLQPRGMQPVPYKGIAPSTLPKPTSAKKSLAERAADLRQQTEQTTFNQPDVPPRILTDYANQSFVALHANGKVEIGAINGPILTIDRSTGSIMIEGDLQLVGDLYVNGCQLNQDNLLEGLTQEYTGMGAVAAQAIPSGTSPQHVHVALDLYNTVEDLTKDLMSIEGLSEQMIEQAQEQWEKQRAVQDLQSIVRTATLRANGAYPLHSPFKSRYAQELKAIKKTTESLTKFFGGGS